MEYTNSRIRELIAEMVHSERNRKILERRLIDGVTFERLAEEQEMSVSQVKRIIWKESERLFRNLKQAGGQEHEAGDL